MDVYCHSLRYWRREDFLWRMVRFHNPPRRPRGVLSTCRTITRNCPSAEAILAGNTLYLSGRIGIDSKTGKAPAEIDDEIKLLLDHVKATLTAAGMTMDDLVYVQVACTDLTLYDKFNAAYRSYFTTKEFPAREFIGVASLLRGGHFELQAIAVKRDRQYYGHSLMC